MRGVPDPVAKLLRQPFEPGPGAPPLRLLAGEPFVHIADMLELSRQQPPDPRAAMNARHGVRTVLFVPLRKDSALLGYISAYRFEVRAFTDKQIALLQNFAAQAVIAMENARLITETREALEQQTATAEVLQVINSSPGDLAPVFDAMLENAMRLSQGAYGHVYLYDGERYHTVAVDAEPHVANWLREYGPFRPRNYDSPLGRLVSGARMVRFGDAREDPGYNTNPGFRTMVDTSGARSGITVALDKDGALQGAISIYRREVRPFSDRQVALLQNFAAQAVIAIENARLITETRERTRDLQETLEYQTATSDVLKVIRQSTFDLQPVLETVVKTAVRLCEADFGYMFRLREGRHQLVASCGLTPEYRDFLLANPFMPDRSTLSGRVAVERGVVHVEDITNDPAWPKGDPSGFIATAQELGNLRTGLGVPLVREGALIGVICLYRARRAFYRQAGCGRVYLCRPGGHRDRERAAVGRVASAHRRGGGVEPWA